MGWLGCLVGSPKDGRAEEEEFAGRQSCGFTSIVNILDHGSVYRQFDRPGYINSQSRKELYDSFPTYTYMSGTVFQSAAHQTMINALVIH